MAKSRRAKRITASAPPPPPPPPIPQKLPSKWSVGWVWVRRRMAQILLIIFLMFREIPNWSSTITFWAAPLQGIGGPLAVIANIVTSRYFSPTIIVAVALYLIFVKHPENLVVRHPWWPIVGWVILGAITIMVLITCVAGYVATVIGPRHLYTSQRNIIESPGNQNGPQYKISFEYDITCPDCGNYARQLEQAFEGNPKWLIVGEASIAGPNFDLLSSTGLSVFSFNDAAKTFLMKTFDEARIPYEMKTAPQDYPNDPDDQSDVTLLISEPENAQ